MQYSYMVSHPALGWLKVGYNVEKLDCHKLHLHLSPFSLYGYRLAIGYFHVVKGGGDSYPRFPSDFGGHGLILCFRFSSTRSLGFGRLAGTEDCSLGSL
jgi:hypothetical protein